MVFRISSCNISFSLTSISDRNWNVGFLSLVTVQQLLSQLGILCELFDGLFSGDIILLREVLLNPNMNLDMYLIEV